MSVYMSLCKHCVCIWCALVCVPGMHLCVYICSVSTYKCCSILIFLLYCFAFSTYHAINGRVNRLSNNLRSTKPGSLITLGPTTHYEWSWGKKMESCLLFPKEQCCRWTANIGHKAGTEISVVLALSWGAEALVQGKESSSSQILIS